METAELEAAYEQLGDVARAISPENVPEPEQWADVNWTLCHVILSNRLLGAAARFICAHEPGVALVVDNLPATDPKVMATMIQSGTHNERIQAVHASAADFLVEVGKVPDEAGGAVVTFRIHDRDGIYVTDSSVLWSDLMRLRAQEHLPAHTERLRRYLPVTS